MATHNTPNGVVLDLRLGAGSIDIETAEGDTTTVELEPLGGDESRAAIEATTEELTIDRDGRTRLRVHVPRNKGGLFRFRGEPAVGMRIVAPPGADLHATVVSADISARGTLRAATAKTVAGDISLGEVTGATELKTVSGDVRCGDAAASMHVDTVSGDVWLERVAGDLAVKTVSGDVRTGAAGSSADVATVSGDIGVASVRQGEAKLQSLSGDVDVAVERGTRVYLDASTLSGDAASDLHLQDAPAAGDGPELTLNASTKSGDVRIRRAAGTAAES
jgi:DUF4097 and DUF4098 domain-containing protein YvlB